MELTLKPTKRYGATAFIGIRESNNTPESYMNLNVLPTHTHTYTRRWHLFGYGILINNTYWFCSESKLVNKIILHGWLPLFVFFSGLILF